MRRKNLILRFQIVEKNETYLKRTKKPHPEDLPGGAKCTMDLFWNSGDHLAPALADDHESRQSESGPEENQSSRFRGARDKD